MEVRLSRDYRGKETKEVFYLKGSVVAMTESQAERLFGLGFAEPVADDGERLAYPGLEDGRGNPYVERGPAMPDAEAIAAQDNAKIVEALKAEQVAEADVDRPFEPADYASPEDEEIEVFVKSKPKNKRRR